MDNASNNYTPLIAKRIFEKPENSISSLIINSNLKKSRNYFSPQITKENHEKLNITEYQIVPHNKSQSKYYHLIERFQNYKIQ